MGNAARQHDAYQRAAEIADLLLRDRIPVIGFHDLDDGMAIGMAFQLTNERAKYACRLPIDQATPERFRELYEAVA